MKSTSSFRDAVGDLLGADARSHEDLVAELTIMLGRSPRVVDVDLTELIRDDPTFVEVSAGYGFIPAMAEATQWTVGVNPEDADDGFLRTEPDLDPLVWWPVSEEVEIVDTDGNVIGVHDTDSFLEDDSDVEILLGPIGWAASLGELAAVEVIDGRFRWTSIATPPSPTERQIDAVRDSLEPASLQDEIERTILTPLPERLAHTSLGELVWEAIARDREAFVDDPIPRLPELLEAAGLELRRATVARAGFDWNGLDLWRAGNRARHQYQLDDRDGEWYVLLWGASRMFIDGEEDALGADADERESAAAMMAGALGRPAVGRALWQRHLDEGGTPEQLARLAAELRGLIGDVDADGLDWLEARCLDHAGRANDAVDLLNAAVARGTEHDQLLLDLAGHLSDAGRVEEALRLLHRADVTPDDPRAAYLDDINIARLLYIELDTARSLRPRPRARRNDPCPCGSGRKYKVCHLGKEPIPLDDRAVWLFQKLDRFAVSRTGAAAANLSAEMFPEGDAMGMAASFGPVIIDLVLHEGGVLSDFAAARHDRLPDDEALLVAQWELAERSLFEVLDERRGDFRLRDLRTGDVITLSNMHLESRPPEGAVVLGRPLPVGDTHRSFSGLVEWDRLRVNEMFDTINEGDPHAIASLLGSQYDPPHLTNTRGEELLFTTMRWELPEGTTAADITAAFETLGIGSGSTSDGAPLWSYAEDTPSMPNAILVSFHFDGDLVADVNSGERAQLAEDLVAEAFPSAVLVGIDERSLAEMAQSFDPSDAPNPLDQNDPEIRAILEQQITQMEERWVDEHIPALGGRTPREAVNDPVGREEVEQLLASFPQTPIDSFSAMSPDRLRHRLDL